MSITEQLQAARAACRALALADTGAKNRLLSAMADALLAAEESILAANAADLAAARGTVPDVMLDRLALSKARIADMAAGMRQVAALPDPVGRVLERRTLDDGLVLEKTAVPMGVIAIIYESRPNVTSDAAALALKSGSACVLRGGKEAFRSNNAIVAALREGVQEAGFAPDLVSLVQDTSRDSARALMTASGLVDLLIPRGGAGLIRSCVENATVPCIQTGTGVCHVYVDAAADLAMALDIVDNAKTSRPSVCNAEEALLVHRDVAAAFLPMLKQRLVDERTAAGLAPVELHLDVRAAAIIDGVPAAPADFDTEYLDYKLSVAVVPSLQDAVEHIARHSTHHSDAIVTGDKVAAARFAACVDSAAVYINASTRFTDGGEFGLGCEMGISTQKLHARGPMGLAELCTYKYIIHGSGQVRGGAAAKLQTPCG
ncbi:MAG TPA: glutamate-5-semialdehyde dehydrogenase [Candidatus Anaerofilum faecale]|nr:glutamate-5-semialdehyde dehydrogenase [Candidatus Anaerofilum faecale]